MTANEELHSLMLLMTQSQKIKFLRKLREEAEKITSNKVSDFELIRYVLQYTNIVVVSACDIYNEK